MFLPPGYRKHGRQMNTDDRPVGLHAIFSFLYHIVGRNETLDELANNNKESYYRY